MWLLNVNTRKLEDFYGSQTPPYAILSHRWEHQEIAFENVDLLSLEREDDVINENSSSPIPYGYTKVLRCCEIVQQINLDYVWIDTCCIDKKSSAELSEAINSMYRWYAEAYICLAYLYDVESVEDLQRSSWFSRAWTLQELLAPRDVVFFNSHWKRLGNRGSPSQAGESELISQCTGIPTRALCDFDSRDYSTATRMSWAARRSATREEDIAYSLLGIFNVNMPLLYGEGTKAFQRLQEEIMKISNDLSIFLWYGRACSGFGLLAESPDCFRTPYEEIPLSDGYSLNNAGLSTKLFVQPIAPGFFAVYIREWRHIVDVQDEASGYKIDWQQDVHGNRLIRTILFARARETDQYTRISSDAADIMRTYDIYRSPDQRHIKLAFLDDIRITRATITSGPKNDCIGFKVTSNATASLSKKVLTQPDGTYATSRRIERGQVADVTCPTMITTGLLGYLIFELSPTEHVTIYLSLDHIFRPFCAAQRGLVVRGDPSHIANKSHDEFVALRNKFEQETPGRFSKSGTIQQDFLTCYAYRGREDMFQTCSFGDRNVQVAFSPRNFGFEVYVECKSARLDMHVHQQNYWCLCTNCAGLTWWGDRRCAKGGVHDYSGSSDYKLTFIDAGGQPDWRLCNKCCALAYSRNGNGVCVATDDGHNFGTSGRYLVTTDEPTKGQQNWRWCSKCQCLNWTDGASKTCAAGGDHDNASSSSYSLFLDEDPVGEQNQWRWCSKCQLLSYDGNSSCAAGGAHVNKGSALYSLTIDHHGASGQSNFKLCDKCYTLVYGGRGGGVCPRGGGHSISNSLKYTVLDSSGTQTQSDWVWCHQCEMLWYEDNGSAPCPAKEPSTHSDDGSRPYFVQISSW